MVAIMNNDLFEKSKDFFESGDILNSLKSFEIFFSQIGKIKEKRKDKDEYISFLEKLLKYCGKNNLHEEEALVLRSLGRIYSFFKQHVESMKYHWKSIKIQKKYGRRLDVAEGLVFLGEDHEVSGNYDKCLEAFEDAAEIYSELGKLRKLKELQKEIARLKEFSKEIVEDEYYMNKFNINKY